MKRFLMMMFAVMALFVMSSCGESKDSYIKDFTKFVEKVFERRLERGGKEIH